MTTANPTPPALEDLVPLERHPDYLPALDKLRDLERQHAAVVAQLDQTNGVLDQARQKGLNDHATDLLASGSTSVQSLQRLETDVGRIHDQRRIIARAIELQKENLTRLRQQVSRKVCLQFAEAHKAAVRKLLEAIVETAIQMEAEHKIREALQLADYSLPSNMLPFTVQSVGFASDYYGGANWRLREAIQAGLIAHDDPLVSRTNAVNGNEDFVPGVAERRARQEKLALQEQERADAERRDGEKEGWGAGLVRHLRRVGGI